VVGSSRKDDPLLRSQVADAEPETALDCGCHCCGGPISPLASHGIAALCAIACYPRVRGLPTDFAERRPQ
jgi:hypothetical protein